MFYPKAAILPTDKGSYRWNYVYLHGGAEDLMAGHYDAHNIGEAPDIFSSNQPMPEEGNYVVTIFGVPAIAVIAKHHGILGGRIALLADTEALRHALDVEAWS
jgi:hypothetical protein